MRTENLPWVPGVVYAGKDNSLLKQHIPDLVQEMKRIDLVGIRIDYSPSICMLSR